MCSHVSDKAKQCTELKMSDDQIIQATWEGEIPIAFSLHGGDDKTYYMSLPRHVYLSMNNDTLREHFATTAPKEDIWFSASDNPLRWNLPVGVLYDAFANSALPWSVTIHTQDFPTTTLLRCPDDNTVKSFFWNSLKQAQFLKYNEIESINNLSVLESNAMWENFVKNDRVKFYNIFQKVVATTKVPRVPLRIIDPSTQKLMKQSPYDVTDTTTFGQFLNEVVPGSVEEEGDHFKLTSQYNISILGILPPLETQMLWIVNRLSNVDGFLYLVTVPNK